MAEARAWFDSLHFYGQVFVGLFVVFIALPIVTLIVLQFLESIRSSRESTRNYGRQQEKGDRERQ
jgi:hypothetical protein